MVVMPIILSKIQAIRADGLKTTRHKAVIMAAARGKGVGSGLDEQVVLPGARPLHYVRARPRHLYPLDVGPTVVETLDGDRLGKLPSGSSTCR